MRSARPTDARRARSSNRPESQRKGPPDGAARFRSSRRSATGSGRGMRFAQLLRTFFAAHFDGLAADLYLDRIGIQFAVAGGTGFLRHGLGSLMAPDVRVCSLGPSATAGAVRFFSDRGNAINRSLPCFPCAWPPSSGRSAAAGTHPSAPAAGQGSDC